MSYLSLSLFFDRFGNYSDTLIRSDKQQGLWQIIMPLWALCTALCKISALWKLRIGLVAVIRSVCNSHLCCWFIFGPSADQQGRKDWAPHPAGSRGDSRSPPPPSSGACIWRFDCCREQLFIVKYPTHWFLNSALNQCLKCAT